MRERLQDDTAAARARTTHQRRHVRLEARPDGGVELVVAGTAPGWTAIEDALHRLAVAAHGTDEEGRTVGQLKHDLLRDIVMDGLTRGAGDRPDPSVPGRRRIDVRLFLTVPALARLGRTKEQAHLAGYGPIDLETAKALAGSARSFVRVLTDPVTGVRLTMDRNAYSPPADLARWVRYRDGRSRFPTSSRSAWTCDVDHAREWQDDGLTEASNLVTLDRAIHLLKSASLLQEQFRADGSVGWLDARGNHFTDPPDQAHDPAPDDLLLGPDDDPCPF